MSKYESYEMAKSVPDGAFDELFWDESKPEAEILPSPPEEQGVAMPVQAGSDEPVPELTMHLCDVCEENEMHGVFPSSCGPISFAYCYECATKGAEPYGALLAYVSTAYGVEHWDNPATQEHFRNSQLVAATLEVAGKTFEEWVSDVRELIIKMDTEMNEMHRKEELQSEVQEEKKHYSYSELSSVYSIPQDKRYTEVADVTYDSTKALFVDYTGRYHLFDVHGPDQFSYYKPVEFVPPGDPRLNK